MFSTLKMVSGAVSDKDIVPIMTCLWFKNGRVQAHNGKLAIDAPFTRPELDCKCIDAKKMLRTIALYDREPRFSVEADELVIQCARKALRLRVLPDDEFKKVAQPPAESHGHISLSALRTLKPFISQDASKPFSITVLLKGGYAYATNNPALVRMPVEYQGPAISMPCWCIDEMLRLKIPRHEVRVTEEGIYFVDGDVWIYARKTPHVWPDVDAKFAGFVAPPLIDKSSILDALDFVEPDAQGDHSAEEHADYRVSG